ncbi:hypothetical protein L7F22_006053 [Adiantum nelumboides]|nr:hypothetical protein [Adiantum nelumboides]
MHGSLALTNHSSSITSTFATTKSCRIDGGGLLWNPSEVISHRVSPNPKPSHQLQARQVGVQRTLACNASVSSSADIPSTMDPGALTFMQEFVKSVVAEALQDVKENLKKKILAKLRNDLGVTLRSLIFE